MKFVIKKQKIIYMKHFIFILILIVFTGCTTDLIYMNVQEPAPVTVPKYVKKIGIINRSLVSDNIINKIDQALTLEEKNLDVEGSGYCIMSLLNGLQKNQNFESVKVLQTDLKSSGAGVFPEPITWEEVNKICQQNDVDILFVLELFDTDTKISYSAVPVKIHTPLGEVSAIEQEATMLVNVKTGWRIYDGKSNTILDEYILNKNITKTGRGVNPIEAAKALIGKKEVVKDVATFIGEEYAMSIQPYWLNVIRDYYTRGSNNLKIAKRKAQVGNWDGAAELWYAETTNPKRKVAKRATYNMAVYNEIIGNLNEAITWAQTSHENYRNKRALQYINILNDRINKINLIQLQHHNIEE